MSAYLVCHHHIDALATFAWKHNTYINHYNTHWRGRDHAQEIAAALWEANVASVTDRYGSTEDHDPYTFKQYPNIDAVSLLQIVKAAQCFDYQACEVPSYEQSLAAAITAAIIGDACRAMTGWKELDWGMPEPKQPPQSTILLSTLAKTPTPTPTPPASKKQDPATDADKVASALFASLRPKAAGKPTSTPTPPKRKDGQDEPF